VSEREITLPVMAFPATEAAALMRLCQKLGHSDALAYLYPHVSKEIRDEQAYQMVRAVARIHEALVDAGATSWPWLETGVA
jgi:hypothetical protein